MTFVPQTMLPSETSVASTVCNEMKEALDAQTKVSQALKTIKDSSQSMANKYNSYQVLAEFFNSKRGDGSNFSVLCTEYAEKVKQDLKSGLQSYLQNMVVQVPIPSTNQDGFTLTALQTNGHDATAWDMINNWGNAANNFSVKWSASCNQEYCEEINNPNVSKNCPWLNGANNIDKAQSGTVKLTEPNGNINLSSSQKCTTVDSSANGDAKSWSDYTQAVNNNSGDGSNPLDNFAKDLPGWEG